MPRSHLVHSFLVQLHKSMEPYGSAIIDGALKDQMSITDFDAYLGKLCSSLEAIEKHGIPKPEDFELACSAYGIWFQEKITLQYRKMVLNGLSGPEFKSRTPRLNNMRRALTKEWKAIETLRDTWQRAPWKEPSSYKPQYVSREMWAERYAKLWHDASEHYNAPGRAFLNSKSGRLKQAQETYLHWLARYRKPPGRPGDYYRACMAIHLLNSGLPMSMVLDTLNALEGKSRFVVEKRDSAELSGPLYAWLRKLQHGPTGPHLPKLRSRRN